LTKLLKAYTIGWIVVEQRKAKRFELTLPIELIQAGSQTVSKVGQTKNMSSAGVLFVSPEEVDIGQPIEYLITFHPGTKGEIRLRCMGKVVRMERRPVDGNGEAEIGIAATLERYEFVR
jgi:hypothetical protein